jgi:hypothetical protein
MPAAAGYYRQAMDWAEILGMRPLVGRCYFGLCKLARRVGEGERAQEYAGTAASLYREIGMGFWPEKAEAEMRLTASSHDAGPTPGLELTEEFRHAPCPAPDDGLSHPRG